MIVFMNIKQRFIAWVLTAISLMAYAPSMFAASPVAWDDTRFDAWIITTPMSARGRFVFVKRESRRMLRLRVLTDQAPYRPFLAERDQI